MKLPNVSRGSLLLASTFALTGSAGAQSLLFEVPGTPGGLGLRDAEFDLDGDGNGDVLFNGRVHAGAGGEVLLDLTPYALGRHEMDVVADLGNSRDGVPDFAIFTDDPFYAPVLILVSGASGEVLGQLNVGNGAESQSFVRNVGDADGDGFDDLLTGMSWFEGPCQYEMARVAFVSGGNADLFPWYITTSGTNGSYLWGVGLGDVNGDGTTNFGIRKTCGGGQYAYLATGTGPINSIYYLGSTTLYDENSLAALGDVDGDGLEDLGILRPQTGKPSHVAVVSGADSLTVILDLPQNASRVAGPGDADCDGVPDVLTTSLTVGDGTWLSSGADGSPLWMAPQPAVDVARVGDVDGDGKGDLGLVVGSKLQVWSTATLPSRHCKQARRGAVPGRPVTR